MNKTFDYMPVSTDSSTLQRSLSIFAHYCRWIRLFFREGMSLLRKVIGNRRGHSPGSYRLTRPLGYACSLLSVIPGCFWRRYVPTKKDPRKLKRSLALYEGVTCELQVDE